MFCHTAHGQFQHPARLLRLHLQAACLIARCAPAVYTSPFCLRAQQEALALCKASVPGRPHRVCLCAGQQELVRPAQGGQAPGACRWVWHGSLHPELEPLQLGLGQTRQRPSLACWRSAGSWPGIRSQQGGPARAGACSGGCTPERPVFKPRPAREACNQVQAGTAKRRRGRMAKLAISLQGLALENRPCGPGSWLENTNCNPTASGSSAKTKPGCRPPQQFSRARQTCSTPGRQGGIGMRALRACQRRATPALAGAGHVALCSLQAPAAPLVGGACALGALFYARHRRRHKRQARPSRLAGGACSPSACQPSLPAIHLA